MILSCPHLKSWQSLLQGSLSETEQAELNAHLESCPTCQQTLEGLVASQESWSGTAEELNRSPLDPTGKLGEVMARLKAQTTGTETLAHPEIGPGTDLNFLQPSEQPGHLGRLKHYEILEILGKGREFSVGPAVLERKHGDPESFFGPDLSRVRARLRSICSCGNRPDPPRRVGRSVGRGNREPRFAQSFQDRLHQAAREVPGPDV